MKTVRALTTIYHNPKQRREMSGRVDRRGRFIVSTAPDHLPPGTIFEASEHEYAGLIKADAVEDVEAAAENDLIG